MKIYRTSDGYRFYLQEDGSLTDSINIEDSDMIYPSLEDLFEDEEPNLIGNTDCEMINKMTPGKYYIGDPCYVLDHDILDRMFISHEKQREKNNTFIDHTGYCIDDRDKHIFKFEGYNYSIISTLIGDGRFNDGTGKEYFVDSGTLSCIPMELIEKYPYINRLGRSETKFTIDNGYGHIVTMTEDFSIQYEDNLDDYIHVVIGKTKINIPAWYFKTNHK